MPVIRSNKFDVARRQLCAAIELFFREFDQISIHTLASASYDAFKVLCNKNGLKNIEDLFIKSESLKIWNDAIRRDYNAFKHADRDENDVINFNTDKNEWIIFLAHYHYHSLIKVSNDETIGRELIDLFSVYFFTLYPELMCIENLPSPIKNIDIKSLKHKHNMDSSQALRKFETFNIRTLMY